MQNNVSIHFKCRGRLYSIMLKKPVEEITLSMVEARIYKKVGLDERNEKLKMSYVPHVIQAELELKICDDEDMHIYLTTIDNENRRCILLVDVINNSGGTEQVSRVEKSSFGKNYEKTTDDEIEANAIVPYVEKEEEEAIQHHEPIEEDDVSNIKESVSVDNDMDRSEKGDLYVEPPPVVVGSQYQGPWEDGLSLTRLQEFKSRRALQEVVDKAAFANSYGYLIRKSNPKRYVLGCNKEGCKWEIRASRVPNTEFFYIRKYTNMHTCTRSSKTSSGSKRRRYGTPELVAAVLHDTFPGKMETPVPRIIMDLVKTKCGVSVSYSTALRGKNLAVSELRGSPEESYKMLYCYLHMLEKVNEGTVTSVKLDEMGKFKYVFVALGACIEGFEVMRKVIIVDATFLKNGYGGVLVFASAQDPNRHHYPIAFGVLDGEKDESWIWFMEMLQTVVPDSSSLVFVSDRNARLVGAIAKVFPTAHHGFCVWHLSQNVKGHASNVNKDVVAWRFMECSRQYTMVDFNNAYMSFKTRYPSAEKYLEETANKASWARACFPGERYNLDTSNCVESLNSVFKDARKWSLIPLLDAIVKTISRWFNEHRKDAVAGSVDNKLVPFVENLMHDMWPDAEKLIVTELNNFELIYHVIGEDGKFYTVNLLEKSCSCKVFDIERYPCLHALAAFIEFKQNVYRSRDFELHELCSRYYWAESWATAYYRTIFLVPDKSQWDVPDEIKIKQIIPPDRKKKKGRNKEKRFPSVGEKRPRTQNKRRPRQGLQWLLWGNVPIV